MPFCRLVDTVLANEIIALQTSEFCLPFCDHDEMAEALGAGPVIERTFLRPVAGCFGNCPLQMLRFSSHRPMDILSLQRRLTPPCEQLSLARIIGCATAPPDHDARASKRHPRNTRLPHRILQRFLTQPIRVGRIIALFRSTEYSAFQIN